MKIIAVPNYETLSCCAADIVEAQIRQKPDTCLGTVTGSSPEGMYRELVRRHREEGLELSRIRTVNTDEYAGLSGTHPQSYHYYLEEHFFRPCGIPSEHTAVPQGDAAARRPSAAVMKHSVAPTRPICRSSASATPATSASTSLQMIFRSSRTLWTLPRRRLPRMLATLTSRTPCRGRLLRSVSVC